MTPPPTLTDILAYARAGAAERAWRMFCEAGLEGVRDDPAVLAARGRVLKARAVAAPPGPARQALYRQASDAYAAAAAKRRETYLLINAASLALLGGDPEAARAGAEAVLAALDANPHEPETAYWLSATRAEALLLLGRTVSARAMLATAIRRAPNAWEDHAPTLRQFALVLDAQGEDQAWLDEFRPPRTLHFAGHMGLGERAEALADKADALLRANRVGFGYGALAAGADIVIAERLVALGGELNVVLPADPAAFRAASVAPAGGDWPARFDALLDQAEVVKTVSSPAPPSDPLAIRLAAEVAMGRAVLRAGQLETSAMQIVVVDRDFGRGRASQWSGALWRNLGHDQHLIAVDADGPPLTTAPEASSALCAVVLAVELTEPLSDQSAADTLPRLRAALPHETVLLRPAAWHGRRVQLAFADPAEAATAAVRLRDSGAPLRVGGSYGLVLNLDDPFGPGKFLSGGSVDLAEQVLGSAPEGAIHLTDDLAAALFAATPAWRLEPVGALASDDPRQETMLYALIG